MTGSSPNVLMIDNYDSFTWNIYEYLCQEGANVTVYRNDKITIPEIEKDIKPDIIVISPGPGHPLSDSGISRDLIKYFSGKLPVIGVCMGQQCIYSVFGGEVDYAGEIVHGKTSTITHDGKGIFEGVSQNIAVTRYHSLAGSKFSLPDCLEVTARSVDSGVIMGVRHKVYTVEGVQFHPESILTQQGHKMVQNFLKIRGGTWEEHNRFSKDNETGSATSYTVPDVKDYPVPVKTVKGFSILDKIFEQRRKDVEEIQKVPGKSFKDLEQDLRLGLAPQQIDFVERITKHSKGKVALMAEIKRASPSKGAIGMSVHAPSQAKLYAEAGASTISVLTEPHWFKGTIGDLQNARLAVDKVSNRPAILRKEFIFDEYQILEARLAGADTVLLIVKMLNDELLLRLYNYSLSLGMEPLVEVADAQEMTTAVRLLSAKVIGINNRDLHSFNVDLKTTSSIISDGSVSIPKDTLLIALSGISSKKDVEPYTSTTDKVKGILVGEALMKAEDTKSFIEQLIN